MARRKGRKMKRTRKKTGLNLVNTAQSYIVASAATRALFGTDLAAFATQGWLTTKTPGQDTGRMDTFGAGNSWSISASELVMGMFGQGFGQSGNAGQGWTNDAAGLSNAIKLNLQRNGARSLGTIIAVPIAFTIGKKLTAAPRRDINKFLKFGNLSSVVKV
tara:strand:+ start:124 stop:606 length:483 start_codon:yes stop_codon:yes gene_type:complete